MHHLVLSICNKDSTDLRGLCQGSQTFFSRLAKSEIHFGIVVVRRERERESELECYRYRNFILLFSLLNMYR